MSVRLFMVEPDGERWRNPATGETLEAPYDFGPGACWRGSYPMHWPSRDSYPAEHWRLHTVWVELPDGAGPFCLDQRATTIKPNPRTGRAEVVYGERWQWSGEPPMLTLRPSIDVKGVWHGWLTDGALTPC